MNGLIQAFLKKVIPPDDSRQALRLRRFFMALAIYGICGFLVYLAYRVDVMDRQAIVGYVIAMPLVNVVFYTIFRTGLNLRASDPSLTIQQICTGIIVAMYGMYYANEARGLFLLVYILILVFGIYRLNTRQFVFLSFFTLVTYGINIVLFYTYYPDDVNFTIEYFQLAVLSIVLLVFSVMAGNISSLRRNLVSNRAMLKESLEKIKHISITDNLTGCYNRLYTSENLDREVNRSLRYKRSISLAMFDIDRFKSVNDTYGHQCGDRILVELVNRVTSGTRKKVDWLVRYGGDEFLLVMPEAGGKQAFQTCQRIRKLVEEMQIEWEGRVIPITVSIGFTCFNPAETAMSVDAEQLVKAADKALYKAKQTGRNKVTADFIKID
ncbi:MAG: GGDEF domain-containing protein [Desulfobacteraceae bacterium]|nr:GGDEF domain-containing protein [Desulfobacteraceae bacterium]